jgi:uncharacterized protein (DUF1778 family)
MAKTVTRDTRVDFRLTQEHKALIEEAAGMVGLTVSQFVATHALEAAHRIVGEHQAISMTRRDFERFLAALDSPAPPNETAMQAAAVYRAWRTGEGEAR